MTQKTREQFEVGDGFVAATHFTNGAQDAPTCLLAPPFSVPARVLDFVADGLVDSGWNVTSFDPRNHVGNSSGEMPDFTMSSYIEDCKTLMKTVDPLVTVGVSLGARAVTRALAEGAPSQNAVLMTPVVDLRSTISTILTWDPFDGDPYDLPPTVEIVGVDVKAPEFISDSHVGGLTSRDKTVDDLKMFDGDITFIAGTHDPWVGIGDVHLVAEHSREVGRDRKVRAIAADTHRIAQCPDLAIRLVGALIEEVLEIGERAGVQS